MSDNFENIISHIEILQKEIEVLKIDKNNLKAIVINLQKQHNELQKELELIKNMINSKKLGSDSNPYENNKLF